MSGTAQPWTTELTMAKEIARLRAEVEKERAGKRSFHALMQQAERERDEALENVSAEARAPRLQRAESMLVLALLRIANMETEVMGLQEHYYGHGAAIAKKALAAWEEGRG